jgi:putative tryptophan/tyrosine transport system substrate-binding protein
MTRLLQDAVAQVRKLPTGLGGAGVEAIERGGIRRREFVALLGAAAAAGWPKAVRSADKITRVGVLWHAGSEEEEAVFLVPFRQALKDLGWPEGRLSLENRYPAERYERYQGYAAELVGLNVDLLVAVTSEGALAAKAATRTIPIVFVVVPDPVGIKLVDSLAHPGGNITGPSILFNDLDAKRLDVFREAVPGLSHLALLTDSNVKEGNTFEGLRNAAKTLGLTIEVAEVPDPGAMQSVFAAFPQTDINGVFVTGSSMFFNERSRIAELALAYHLPTAVFDLEMVRAGGLVFYGSSIVTAFRRTAGYVDKILRGAKPADLPVEQPTRFELAINLKTAAALKQTIPPMLLGRADEVIE